MKKTFYIIALILLLMPVGLYINKYFESEVSSLIVNQEIERYPSAAGIALKSWKPGQILVKAKDGLPPAELEKILTANQGRLLERIGNLPVYIATVADNTEESVAASLSRNPYIDFAELNMAVEPSNTVPNDAEFSNQWYLSKIHTPIAWDISKANGITIAILDSGIEDTHPDLSEKIIPGINAMDDSLDTSDLSGHGTNVAGIVAAATDNMVGVAGVAWYANILPVKITNRRDGDAYWSDIARGMNWAADNGADVANVSYAVTESSTITSAAQYLRRKGAFVVVAAGNNGVDLGVADNPYLFTVSATDRNDNKADWSNYGAAIDIAAPGSAMLSTSVKNGYSVVSGTSHASAATAGVVGLIKAVNQDLTVDEIESVIKNSADKVSGTVFHPSFGYGRINAATAVQMATEFTGRDRRAPIVDISSPTTAMVVSGLVPIELNAIDNVRVSAVSLYANGHLVATDDVWPFEFIWDSSTEANGAANLTVSASDTAGNESASSVVSVTVRN
ncbi:MAG: S8 family serine peptidase [Gammaproteobacteria bacterium]